MLGATPCSIDGLIERAARGGDPRGAALRRGAYQVTFVLTDDAEMRTLNRTWRGKDAATNVLSFPAHEKVKGPGLLGDVVIAFETTSKEARAQHIAFDDHVAHLVVHGVLHLLGFDHIEDAEAERMEAIERTRACVARDRRSLRRRRGGTGHEQHPDRRRRRSGRRTAPVRRGGILVRSPAAKVRSRRGARSARADRGRAGAQQERHAERAGARHAASHPPLRQSHGRGRHGAARRHHRRRRQHHHRRADARVPPGRAFAAAGLSRDAR